MLFSTKAKAFPTLTFIIGLNLGVILTYLYGSSVKYSAPTVDPSDFTDGEIEVLDLDHNKEIHVHEGKQTNLPMYIKSSKMSTSKMAVLSKWRLVLNKHSS